MATLALNQHESLTRPLLVSAGGHALVLVFMLMGFHHHHAGEPWGGPGGGAIQVSVVRSLPGVPLPRPPVVAESRAATEAPGLHPAAPKKAAPEKEARATELPRFGGEKRPPAAPPRQEERPTFLSPGAIPSPGSGPVALPYTPFQASGAEGGMSFGSGGAFGARYPWYVESVRRRIGSNWVLSTVDPYVKWAPRAVLTFEILRNGTIVNVEVLQSSGVASVDRSALRAVQESSPLERLPSDYTGDKVLVEFWFDFRRPQ